MGTVTGLTAERMLAIEAESIIDGDVVGNNLILKRHDGVTIDAGPVKGPKGDTGQAGISVAQNNLPVLDVGIAGQIRAGRQLTVADFTRMGLQQPIGLFNLSDLSNLGSGGPLVSEGSVPFGVGINGLAASCAVFSGSAAQSLNIPDAAGGAFNPKTLTLGAWFRTAKRGTSLQTIAGKSGAGATIAVGGYLLYINSNNAVQAWVTNGVNDVNAIGVTDICDDRWHFAVMTFDGVRACLYVDGVLESVATNSGNISMVPNQINEPFSIGASDADSASNSNLFWGRIDEVFVTSEVLSDDQVRSLYCAKIPHGASSTPINTIINVHRRRKGAAWVPGDFPTLPRRIYNLNSLLDSGSDNVALVNNNGAVLAAAADGTKDGAYLFSATQYLSGSDAGLPTTGDRSIGAWFKCTGSSMAIVSYGQNVGDGGFDLRLGVSGLAGQLVLDTYTTNRVNSSAVFNDGQWHFAVVTYQTAPADGLRFKLYCDGRLVDAQIGAAITTVLTGPAGFKVGRNVAGGENMSGAIDGAFLTDYVLTSEQIRALYAKGSQDLGASPKVASEHIESFDSANIYAIFDSLESQNLVDLAVAS